MAEEMNVAFLGRVPMEKISRECGDAGTPVVLKYPKSKTARAFAEIARNVIELL
jgi:ATP-binding protein involved in chromosome partitioning